MEMVVGERERAKEADKPRETEKLTEMATAREACESVVAPKMATRGVVI